MRGEDSGDESKKTPKKDPSKKRRSQAPVKSVRKFKQLYSEASLMLTPFESMSVADVKVHLDLLKRERLLGQMNPILVKLMSHPKNGGTFNAPLDWRSQALNLPDYLKVIETPMDFATIKARVLQGFYPSKRNFVADLRLVFFNAKKYNPPSHPVHKNATELLAELERELQKLKASTEATKNQKTEHNCAQCRGRTCVLCSEKCRGMDPPILQCFGRTCGQRIKQGTVFYVTADGLRAWCFKCYATLGAILPTDDSVPDEREKEEEEKKMEEKRKREERKLSNDYPTLSTRGKSRDKSSEASMGPPSPEIHNDNDDIMFDDNAVAPREQQAATSSTPATPAPVQYKAALMKRTLFEDVEKWVQCDSCSRWLHEVCGLHQNITEHATANEKKEPDKGYIFPALREVYVEFLKTLSSGGQAALKYRCPLCRSHDTKNLDGNSFKMPRRLKLSDCPEPTKGYFFRAASLPETPTAMFIESCLRKRLQQLAEDQLSSGVGVDVETQADVGEVYVRMVACSEHTWNPDSQLKDVFSDVPETLTYTAKTFMVFQTRNGVDLCLLCLYVQEYGPNQGASSNRVYISYLDSVDYFRPRHARQRIYYEMLVSYFAWLRLRGFTAVHIWACPPKRGCGYVFWQRPPHQKTPYRGRLVQWYKDMCQRALEIGCCVGVGSFFTESFQGYLSEKPSRSLSSLSVNGSIKEEPKPPETKPETKLEPMPPAFEGDYWLTKANNLCRLRSWRLLQLAARPRPTVKDAMDTILKKLKKHGSARVFNKPVDADALNIPQYRQVIKKPMDFGTIREKFVAGLYPCPKDMADDIRLVFDNAIKFNPQGHWIHKAALTMRDYFEKEAREVLLAQSHVKVRLRSGEHLDPFTPELQWDDTASDPEWETQFASEDLGMPTPSLLRKLSEEAKSPQKTVCAECCVSGGCVHTSKPKAIQPLTVVKLEPLTATSFGSTTSSASISPSLSSAQTPPMLPSSPLPPASSSCCSSSSTYIMSPPLSSLPPPTLSMSPSLSSLSTPSNSLSSLSLSSTSSSSLSSLPPPPPCASVSFPPSSPSPEDVAASAPALLAASGLATSNTAGGNSSTKSSSRSATQTVSQPPPPMPPPPAPSPPPSPVKPDIPVATTTVPPPRPSRSSSSEFQTNSLAETPIAILPPPPTPPPPAPPPPLPPVIPENPPPPTPPLSPTLTAQQPTTSKRRRFASPHSRSRMAPPMPAPMWPMLDPGLSSLYSQSLTPETAEQLHQYHQFQQYYRPHMQAPHYPLEFQELQHQQQLQLQQHHDALHAFQSQNANFDWPPWLTSFPGHPSSHANALALALSSFPPESTFPNFHSLSPSSASFLLQALSPPISPLALTSQTAASEMFANLIKSLPHPGAPGSSAPDASFLPLDRQLEYGFPYTTSSSQWRPELTDTSPAVEVPMLEVPTNPLPPPSPSLSLPTPKRARKTGRTKKTPKTTIASSTPTPKKETTKKEPKATPAKPVKAPKTPKTPKVVPPPPPPSPSPSPSPRPTRKKPAPPLPTPTPAHNWRKASIPQVPRLLAADMKRSIEEFFVLYLQDDTFAKVTSKSEPPSSEVGASTPKVGGKRKSTGLKQAPRKDTKDLKIVPPAEARNGDSSEVGDADGSFSATFSGYVTPHLKAAKVELGNIPEDPFMFQPLFESRHTFMQTCQLRHWHFDTLRHAKHASSSILYHLNTADACDATKLICRMCNTSIEGTVRWHIQAACGPPLTEEEKEAMEESSPSNSSTQPDETEKPARTFNIAETEEGELCSACYSTLGPEEAELFTPFRMY